MKLFLAKKGEILTSIERLLHNCFCYTISFLRKKYKQQKMRINAFQKEYFLSELHVYHGGTWGKCTFRALCSFLFYHMSYGPMSRKYRILSLVDQQMDRHKNTRHCTMRRHLQIKNVNIIYIYYNINLLNSLPAIRIDNASKGKTSPSGRSTS